ncbi:glycosyltransferase family 4 protein [Verrucomicrobiota bacterium]
MFNHNEVAQEQEGSDPCVLWMGGIFDETTLLSHLSVSPAANRWQACFVNALNQERWSVKTIGHLPEPFWPRGRLYVHKNAGSLISGLEGSLMGYWNIPFVRSGYLAFQYRKACRLISCKCKKPRVIISYNLLPWTCNAGCYMKRKFDIPWICVVADAPDEKYALSRHDALLKQADGRIFLSWESYRSFRDGPKIHIDGGVKKCRLYNRQERQKRVILYSGVMSRYGGVDLLIDAFKLVGNTDTELWLCGSGKNIHVRNVSRKDPRIKVFGLVSEKRLVKLARRASVFVNPRPDIFASRHNFPSKILEYLSYEKPVVSTWTPGLSPEYREILCFVERNSPEALASKLEEVLSWSENDYKQMSVRIRSFLERCKFWGYQVRRFIDWLDHDVVPGIKALR